MKLFSLTVCAQILCLGGFAHAAIFGADDRHVITPASPMHELSRATAILVLTPNRDIDLVSGLVNADAPPLAGVCSDEPFAKDPSFDYSCTGFLVAPDLLVTAGHCVYALNTPNRERVNETKDGCETFNWLFDFEATATAPAATKNIPRDHLFACKQIVYATQTEAAPFLDYALIQLDRPAVGRTPFKFDETPAVLREAVAMIGYPHGTPVKYTDSAVVTLNTSHRDSFLTNLDAAEGNSGSPVFNANHAVVGILIGGTPSNDFVTDSARQCQKSNHCNESGTKCDLADTADFISQLTGYQGIGSEVQRIAPIAEMVKRINAGLPAR